MHFYAGLAEFTAIPKSCAQRITKPATLPKMLHSESKHCSSFCLPLSIIELTIASKTVTQGFQFGFCFYPDASGGLRLLRVIDSYLEIEFGHNLNSSSQMKSR